jgi:nitrate/nitrite transporter NarK
VTDIGLDQITGVSINKLTGYLVAIPFTLAIASMIWWGRHSDATRERIWHAAGPAIVSGLSLISAADLGNPIFVAIALAIGVMSGEMFAATFWTLPTDFLTGSAAAGGIALINSIGNIAGFVGTYTIGWVKDATGEISRGFAVLALFQITAGFATLLMGHDSRMEMAGSHKSWKGRK